jgi:MATE family multidrug resistance protein
MIALWARELRAILNIALPLAGAQLAYMVMATTDAVMMGRIGTDALAAGGLGSTVAVLLIFVALGLLQGIQPIVAIARGAGDQPTFARTLAAGLVVGIASSVPIMLVLFQVEPLLTALDEPKTIARLAGIYERAFAWAVPGLLLTGAIRNYLTAFGRTGVILAVAAAACGINLLLNWMLIFGHFGWPALGLAGSAYATAMANWSMGAALTVYAWQERLLPAGLFRLRWRQMRSGLASLLALGVPAAALESIEIGFFSASSLLMARFGPVALAAHQICLNLCALTYMVPLGIATGATVRVGLHVGSRAWNDAKVAGMVALALGASVMLVIAIWLRLFAGPILGLYLDAGDPSLPQVQALGTAMLTLAALFQVFDGIQCVAIGALRGLRDVTVPLVLAIVGYWGLGLPIGALFAYATPLGPIGLWCGIATGLVVVAVLLAIRFRDRAGLRISAPPLRFASAG